jgi:hypothetical protein
MSILASIVAVVVLYRFWGLLRNVERSSRIAANSGLTALVKGAAKLEASTPSLTEEETRELLKGRKQLRLLERLDEMTEEELLSYFEAEAKK